MNWFILDIIPPTLHINTGDFTDDMVGTFLVVSSLAWRGVDPGASNKGGSSPTWATGKKNMKSWLVSMRFP